jgi:hypothetical protein
MQQVTAAIPVARIELNRPRLEDVFVQLVNDGTASAEAASTLRAQLQGASDAEAAQ